MIEETALRWGTPGGRWPFPNWTLERVTQVYHHVAGLLTENDDKIDGDWFEDVAALARVILSERAQDRDVQQAFPRK